MNIIGRLEFELTYFETVIQHFNHYTTGGARSVMVIVAENGHGDTNSNPGRD